MVLVGLVALIKEGSFELNCIQPSTLGEVIVRMA